MARLRSDLEASYWSTIDGFGENDEVLVVEVNLCMLIIEVFRFIVNRFNELDISDRAFCLSFFIVFTIAEGVVLRKKFHPIRI